MSAATQICPTPQSRARLRPDRAVRDHRLETHFTEQERRIIVLLVEEALSSKEVALRLDLAVKTVETHRANIMRKLAYMLKRTPQQGVKWLDLAYFALTHELASMARIEARYSESGYSGA